MKDVSSIFNKYAGKKLAYPTKMRDFTIDEIRKTAAANGYTIRVIYPGAAITDDYCETRVNVPVVKTKKGYFVGRKFELY